MVDLKTKYMGLELRNPIIVGSSGLAKSLSGIKRCEDAGVGAVVLKSIFEEQYQVEQNIPEENINVYPEALDYMRSGGLLEYAPKELTTMIGFRSSNPMYWVFKSTMTISVLNYCSPYAVFMYSFMRHCLVPP